ncbi:MAG: Asp-tRNA(Asn)/Glu-tRNA(Gln) amidotransferase subunit GatB [Candidatus Omnitrophota bacterium]
MYEAVIGLEVHLQLATRTKAFCSCSTEFGKAPNSQVCQVCLGFPGALPVLNRTALDLAIKVGLALNCSAQEHTKFDRKNYFYPDLPKNYQISQYDLPLARNGFLDICLEDNSKRIGIRRVHLEEDAGKLIHRSDKSLVDFNRAGIPLLEIVSEPDINSPEEAHEYLRELKKILEYLEVSDCDMEKGSLRCDANISLRKKGTKALGVKSELKNMNSFKAVREALGFEITRQSQMLAAGEALAQETRLWDEKKGETFPMRTKEEAQDYRYFPEPDLPLFVIDKDKIAAIKSTIPALPREMMRRLEEYGLSRYESGILADFKQDAGFAGRCFDIYPHKNKKPLTNFLIGPLLSEANSRGCMMSELGITPEGLIELLSLLDEGKISNLVAKAALSEMIETKKPAAEIIAKKNLMQISDTAELEGIIKDVIKENQKSADDFRSGKGGALMFLVGQVMKKTAGKANPKAVQGILKERLKE